MLLTKVARCRPDAEGSLDRHRRFSLSEITRRLQTRIALSWRWRHAIRGEQGRMSNPFQSCPYGVPTSFIRSDAEKPALATTTTSVVMFDRLDLRARLIGGWPSQHFRLLLASAAFLYLSRESRGGRNFCVGRSVFVSISRSLTGRREQARLPLLVLSTNQWLS